MELSVEQSLIIWRTIFLLYAVGYWFQADNKRHLTLLCWLSCAAGLIIFNTGHMINEYLYQTFQTIIPVTFILYAVLDSAVYGFLRRMMAGIIPFMYLFMIFSHGAMVLCDMLASRFPILANSIYLYEPAMIAAHIAVLASLFRGSHGCAFICRIVGKLGVYCRYLCGRDSGSSSTSHHHGGVS